MMVAGETIYIISDGRDDAAVWKDTSALSMDPIMSKKYTWMGLSKASIKALYSVNANAK
jgi:hypothetical protein